MFGAYDYSMDYSDYSDLRGNQTKNTCTRNEYLLFGEYIDPVLDDNSKCSEFIGNCVFIIKRIIELCKNTYQLVKESLDEFLLRYSKSSECNGAASSLPMEVLK